MSRTYEALMLAERLRAAQDPAALARQLAEERETLSARLAAFEDQLSGLAASLQALPSADPGVVDRLVTEVARLVSEQERWTSEEKKRLEESTRSWREEVTSLAESLQLQAATSERLSSWVAEIESLSSSLEDLRGAVGDLRRGEDRRRQESEATKSLSARVEALRRDLAEMQERTTVGARDLQAIVLRVEERSTEHGRKLASVSQEISRQLMSALEESALQQRGIVGRLAELEQDRHDTELRLRGLVDAQHTAALERDKGWLEQLEAVRGELVTLAETQRRLGRELERIESAKEKVEDVVLRAAVIEEVQATSVASLHERMERLVSQQEKVFGSLATLESEVETASHWGREVQALRARIASLDEERDRSREQNARILQAQSEAAEVLARLAAAGEGHASELTTFQEQLTALWGESQALRDSIETLPEVLRENLATVEDMRALHASVTLVAEEQAKQSDLGERFVTIQAAVEGSVRRLAELDEARRSRERELQRRVDILQAEGDALRHGLDAVRSSVARQLELAAEAEVEALREQIAPLVEAQMRQDRLVKDVHQAQATADEAVRLAKIDKGYVSGLASLREQIGDLLQDRAKLDQGIERRFELLCGIVDETIQHEKTRMEHGVALFQEETARRTAELESKLERMEAALAGLCVGGEPKGVSPRPPRKSLTSVLSRGRTSRKP